MSALALFGGFGGMLARFDSESSGGYRRRNAQPENEY
jgi:hypothetical protein